MTATVHHHRAAPPGTWPVQPRTRPACSHWNGQRHCGNPAADLYPVGPRCDQHCPAAVAARFAEHPATRTETIP